MKATVRDDIIIGVGAGKTEIGAIPKRVGIERLRWDGTKLVDLLTLSEMWVRQVNGVFELHAVPVQNSQSVTMRYEERKHLVNESGVIRVKSLAERVAAVAADDSDVRDNRSLRAELVDLVKTLTYAKVDTHIDTVFSGLSAAQRASLKKLYKVVLYLAKSNLGRQSNG